MKRYLAMLMFIILPASSFASDCSHAWIKSLKIGSSSQYIADHDYCKDSAPPSEIGKLIQSIEKLNRRVASFLGLAPDLLFPNGLEMEIYIGDSGGINSGTNGETVTLYVFPGWKPDSEGGGLNQSIYFHEMGHVLSAQENSKVLPIALNSLSNFPLMTEGFSDMLALELTGSVFGGDTTNEGCASKARVITRNQSYNYPRDFFNFNYWRRKVVSCCRKTVNGDYASDERSQALHSFCVDQLDTANDLAPMDRITPFTSAEYVSAPYSLDNHQLGIDRFHGTEPGDFSDRSHRSVSDVLFI